MDQNCQYKSLPELEEIMEIGTREKEKILRKKEDAVGMCKELVEELVSGIEASTVTRSIMKEVLESAWESIELENTWRVIDLDPDMEIKILKRIRLKEEDRAKIKEMELEASRKSLWAEKKKEITARRRMKHGVTAKPHMVEEMTLAMEDNVLEEETEHKFLEEYLVGVEKAEIDIGDDWEIIEMDHLESVLEGDSQGHVEDLMDKVMRSYLTNTNLINKRMVGATIMVESHSSKSELSRLGNTEIIRIQCYTNLSMC
jgi:hypothetical protein